MKKLLSLALALIIAATLPVAVFAEGGPEINVYCEGGGSPVAAVVSENEEVYRIRVTFNPNENMEIDYVSATGSVGAFEEYLMFEDKFPFIPAWIEFDASKEYNLITVVVAFKESGATFLKGDLDGDGEITVSDALAALRIAAKLAEETDDAIRIGDADGDGEITVSDALAILRVAAKLADKL